MAIDYSNFFEIKANQKHYLKTITIYENGRIKLSRAIAEKLEEEKVALYIANDYRRLILNPKKEELKVKPDGTIQARQSIEELKRQGAAFPLAYEMEWNQEEGLWLGTLKILTSSGRKSVNKKTKLEELI